jgi:acyl-coenzyme A synthetase/AMP-(fatty) acid ligase
MDILITLTRESQHFTRYGSAPVISPSTAGEGGWILHSGPEEGIAQVQGVCRSQVALVELDNHLITHNEVLEAAVVGIPVEGGSEVPRAYVVLRRVGASSEEEVKQYVKQQHLADYTQLRGGVQFVDELPKNAVGKILRRELRDRAKAEEGVTAKL